MLNGRTIIPSQYVCIICGEHHSPQSIPIQSTAGQGEIVSSKHEVAKAEGAVELGENKKGDKKPSLQEFMEAASVHSVTLCTHCKIPSFSAVVERERNNIGAYYTTRKFSLPTGGFFLAPAEG